MAIDAEALRELLPTRRGELDEEDRLSAGDRAPVALDQESVGRLSRIDAMQVQAMALTQERRRKTSGPRSMPRSCASKALTSAIASNAAMRSPRRGCATTRPH